MGAGTPMRSQRKQLPAAPSSITHTVFSTASHLIPSLHLFNYASSAQSCLFFVPAKRQCPCLIFVNFLSLALCSNLALTPFSCPACVSPQPLCSIEQLKCPPLSFNKLITISRTNTLPRHPCSTSSKPNFTGIGKS
jgi:hypothetical protein